MGEEKSRARQEVGSISAALSSPVFVPPRKEEDDEERKGKKGKEKERSIDDDGLFRGDECGLIFPNSGW